MLIIIFKNSTIPKFKLSLCSIENIKISVSFQESNMQSNVKGNTFYNYVVQLKKYYGLWYFIIFLIYVNLNFLFVVMYFHILNIRLHLIYIILMILISTLNEDTITESASGPSFSWPLSINCICSVEELKTGKKKRGEQDPKNWVL